MKRNLYHKIHNYIIKPISCVMSLIFIISMSGLDSESWLPAIACVVSMGWLVVYAWATGMLNDGCEEEGEENVLQ